MASNLGLREVKGKKFSSKWKITIRSVMQYISGTVKHMLMVFGTLVLNDDISRVFFKFFKLFFWDVRGMGKKLPKMKYNYIHHMPYLRNIVAYDHDFWCTSVK